MTFKTPLEPIDLTAPHYGHDLFEPVDDAHAWPDLRHRPLTDTECAALLEHAAMLEEAVMRFDARLNKEQDVLRKNKVFTEDVKPPYVPGLLIGLILIPLRQAQRALEERYNDEIAVSYLRVADVLTRLLHTWREARWEQLVDELVLRIGAIIAALPIEPRFVVLPPPMEA